MKEHTEVERTYDPDGVEALPDLRLLDGVVTVGEPDLVVLRATYYDSHDLVLLRAGVTLRRRSGGDDEGWHAKIPAGDGRRELRLPLTDERTPPPELVEAVRGWSQGAALEAVATIETQRTERRLLAEDGAVLAVLADDQVTGWPGDGAAPVCWREWELELVAGPAELLEAADRVMAAAGVCRSAVDRKIVHVLGERADTRSRRPVPARDRPAGDLLRRRLVEQVAELHRLEAETRDRDFAEGVHQVRIVCRRLRSALAAYRPLVDRTATEPLREELRWLGQQLSGARDGGVIAEELLAMVASQPGGLVWGPVGARIAHTYTQIGQREAERVRELLSSERYDALLTRLDRLSAAPPFTERAAEPTGTVVPRLLRKEWRRLEARVVAIESGPRRDVTTHDARKAAKRMRYALEAAEPVWPKEATRLRKAVKRLTTVLGERQDTVVARQHLVRLAGEAAAAGESAFTYGRLHGLAESRARELDVAFAREWRGASRKKLRRWLS